jgi:hypothetical protein
MKTTIVVAAFALTVLPALADPPANGRAHLAEMGDPYVPPAARKPSLAPPTSGEALRQQVERKLQRQFEAADTQGTGSITAEQARRAGWGYLVNHFEQIDTAHSGRVSFDQVKRYLRLDQAGP